MIMGSPWAALPLVLGAGGVNWTLLGIALVILVGGGIALMVHFRSVRRRSVIRDLRSHRTTGRAGNGPAAQTFRDPPPDGLRKAYDEAVARGDFGAAALYAKKMHDPRLYALALERSGDVERAVAAWVEIDEFHRAAKLLLDAGQPGKAARLYVQVGSHKKAIDSFVAAGATNEAARLLRQIGDEQRANLLDGEYRAKRGEYLAAARHFVAAKDMMKAAEMLLKAGDIPKAVEALRRGGKADEAARIFHDRGDYKPAALLYQEAEQWAEAAACHDAMGDHEAQAKCLAKAGKGYQAGRLAFERGDFDRALQYFEALGPIDTHFADAGLFRGQIYERRGQLQESGDAYSTFLKDRSPDEKNKILFLRVAQIQEGIGKLRSALQTLGRLITAGLGTPDVTAWAARLERATMDEFETEALESKRPERSSKKKKGAGRGKRAKSGAPAGLRGATLAGASRGGARPAGEDHKTDDSGLPADLAAEANQSDPPAIQVLDRRYKFKGRVGQGGNGVVYKATDRALGREVVVKFLHQALLPTEVARKYFQREAKTAASLNHPNIVTIFDIGQEGETLYFSMELVEGQTLADLIVDSGGTLTHEQVRPLIVQLGSALDYAHNRQVIHRDIKPGNIMVDGFEQVKLLDFGLAKALDENPDKSVFLCGTPFYMSPEQIRRDFLDHRTDIYSLGCLLYVMYCGDVPFPDGNVFYHHQHTDPPNPRDLNPSLPDGVAEVLLRSVAKDRAERFQKASDVAAALAAI